MFTSFEKFAFFYKIGLCYQIKITDKKVIATLLVQSIISLHVFAQEPQTLFSGNQNVYGLLSCLLMK
jgi:hypothetical protein